MSAWELGVPRELVLKLSLRGKSKFTRQKVVMGTAERHEGSVRQWTRCQAETRSYGNWGDAEQFGFI